MKCFIVKTHFDLVCDFLIPSDRPSEPSATSGGGQIQSAQQRGQLLGAQPKLAFALRRFRPAETTPLQTLAAQPQAAPVPKQQLEAAATAIGEDKHVT